MEQKIKALFAWQGQAREAEATANKIAQIYAAAGVETILLGEALEAELISLGQKQEATHVLYFLDEKKLLLVSLVDEMGGFTVEVFVTDLVMP